MAVLSDNNQFSPQKKKSGFLGPIGTTNPMPPKEQIPDTDFAQNRPTVKQASMEDRFSGLFSPGGSQKSSFDIEKRRQELQDKYRPYITDLQGMMDQLKGVQEQNQDVLTNVYEARKPTIQNYIDQIEAGPGQYVDEGMEYAAKLQGYDTLDQYKQDLQRKRDMGIGDVEGLTPEARELFERQKRTNLAETERLAKDQLEVIYANTNSTTRYLAAADGVRQQISDQRLQYDLAISQEDYSRRLNEIKRNDDQYRTMLQSGQMATSQYMAQRQAAVESALGNYMKDMVVELDVTGNQAAMDYNNVLQQTNLIYQSATLEMGIDEGVINQVESEFQMHHAPELMEMYKQELMNADTQMKDTMAGVSSMGMQIGGGMMMIPGFQGAGLAVMGVSALTGFLGQMFG